MIEDKDDGPVAGPAAANDPGNGSGDVPAAELPDEGVPVDADTRLATVEAELADTKDRLLRALAETENVRRRLQRERDDAQKYAVGVFAKDLLSTADDLRRALDAMPEAELADPRAKGLRDGVAATERELLAAFERHGLKRIDPKGEPFDHNFHQAIFEAERPDLPAGTVVEVLQPGYVLHDRLLRPAMVGVAKGGARAAGLDQEKLDELYALARAGKAGSNVTAGEDSHGRKELVVYPDLYEKMPGDVWRQVS